MVQIASLSQVKGEKLLFGVLQRSIFGLILFFIYVNERNTAIKDGKQIQFAVDTTLCYKVISKQKLETDSFLEFNSCIQ